MIRSNKFAIDSLDFPLRVALGEIPNVSLFHKFAVNPDVDVATEDIWVVGGIRVLPITSAPLTLTYSMGDVGKVVRIVGLDLAYQPVTEDVTLPAGTSTMSTNNYFRVNSGEIIGNAANVGVIDIAHGVNTQARIAVGANITKLSQYTTAANESLLINRVEVNAVDAGEVRFIAQTKPFGLGWRDVRNINIYRNTVSAVGINRFVPPKTEVRVQVSSANSNKEGSVEWGGYRYLI